jgi:DNA-binding GntR family transcriptional regulator
MVAEGTTQEMPDTNQYSEMVAIKRPSLHQEIVGQLRDMIVDGRLQPGTFIAEPLLCRQLQVSRTPLREALKVLASEGLVDLATNRGAMVADITLEETVDLFEVLEGLEGNVGELAAQRMTEREIEEIEQLHERMKAYHRQSERREYFSSNLEFHRRFIAGARNKVLASTHESVTRRAARARYAANASEVRWGESVAEHEQILAALKERDGALLSQRLRTHLHKTGATIVEALKRTSLIRHD